MYNKPHLPFKLFNVQRGVIDKEVNFDLKSNHLHSGKSVYLVETH